VRNSIGDGRKTNLVDHHDAKQVTDGSKEQSIEIVIKLVANLLGECIQNDLTYGKEEDSKYNITQWPSILQGSHDQQNLTDNIDRDKQGIKNIQQYEQARCLGWVQTSIAVEGKESNHSSDDEHDCASTTEEPYGERGTIFVDLVANETVDEETYAKSRDEAALDGDEVRVGSVANGDDAGVETEGDQGEGHEEVEEKCYFFPTCMALVLLYAEVGSLPRQHQQRGRYLVRDTYQLQ
jgi:hypothetical protein